LIVGSQGTAAGSSVVRNSTDAAPAVSPSLVMVIVALSVLSLNS
jgi:hypothetical protein